MSCEDRKSGKDATENPSEPPITRAWTPNDLGRDLIGWYESENIPVFDPTASPDASDSTDNPIWINSSVWGSDHDLINNEGTAPNPVRIQLGPGDSVIEPPEAHGGGPTRYDDNHPSDGPFFNAFYFRGQLSSDLDDGWRKNNYFTPRDATEFHIEIDGDYAVFAVTQSIFQSDLAEMGTEYGEFFQSQTDGESFFSINDAIGSLGDEEEEPQRTNNFYINQGYNVSTLTDTGYATESFTRGELRNVFNKSRPFIYPDPAIDPTTRVSETVLRQVPDLNNSSNQSEYTLRTRMSRAGVAPTSTLVPFSTLVDDFRIEDVFLGKRPILNDVAEEKFGHFVVMEFLIVKTSDENVLTTDNVDRIRSYLAHKYGVAEDNLFSFEPYYNEPPTIIVESESQQQSLAVTETGPFDILGYYPLYRTKQAARNASPTPDEARTVEERRRGLVGFHIHVLNDIEYYMPNGLDAIGQQFHGNYGIQTEIPVGENLKTGIDSIDQQRDNKNYRYIGFYSGSAISSSDLNEFQQNIREGFSFLGEVGFSWPYYNGSESENMRVGAGHWNGATPLFPDRISLGSGVGNYTERTITLPNPLSIRDNTNDINVTFLEADYFSVDKTRGGDGLRYPVRLSYTLANESDFALSIPKLSSGRTIIGLNMLQREIDSNQDPSFKPKRSKSLGPTRIQINFSGADFVDSVNLEDAENFAPVFYIDHLNKEIRYMNNLLITKIT